MKRIQDCIDLIRKEAESKIKQISEEAAARESAAMSHYKAGKQDCANGVYDKWYRYNATHDGAAYDIGWLEQNEDTQNEIVRFI